MIHKYLNFKSLIASILILFSFSLQAQVDIDAGKNLFKTNCGSCHAKNMKSKSTGPALGGAYENWEDEGDLYAWIRNSQAMIAAGNARSVELWNEYKPTVMTSFEKLTDDEIASILVYIDGVYTGIYPPVVNDSRTGVTNLESDNGPSKWLYALLLAILGGLALLLTRIIGNLNKLAALQDGDDSYEPKTLLQTLTSKSIVGFAIFTLVLFAGYTTVNNAVALGRQQGYAPEQPIKFSHETHAGVNKIECQYCHDGARRSKHSVIPAANTCMNCHKAITYGSEYGSAEISKIFASIGYDPTTATYIEDYEDMPQEKIKEVYTKWMADSYIENNDDVTDLDADGKRLVEDQWNDLVASLTNDQKTKVQGPIEWTRIHNLPDHVYFNHAQHVTVGKVECQTCHGNVEEMEVAQQMAPLSMGWCINCHRQTEVKFNSNEYYASYAKYHEELKEGTRDKVTVADIGGLECQKCHY